MNIGEFLAEREKTHGDYVEGAKLLEALWTVLGSPFDDPVLNRGFSDMISKIVRIRTGDCREPDHWKDIAGYATLVQYYLERDKVG